MHNCQLHKFRERLRTLYKVNLETLLFYSSPDVEDVESLFVRAFTHSDLFISLCVLPLVVLQGNSP